MSVLKFYKHPMPALSFVWDVLFFNRQTGIAGRAGAGMVLAAIYLGMTGGAKK